MISDYRCFYCFARAFEKLLIKENISNEAKYSFTQDMIRLYQQNSNNFCAPTFSSELYAILRGYTHNPDPYKDEKRENNDLALSMAPLLEKTIRDSRDPFYTALRLSIAGNIIDFAAGDNFDLKSTVDKVLSSEFAIDHSQLLRARIEDAELVLYLGDNAGEIVFDKYFIRTIDHKNLVYVVRGGPVINDATLEDAGYTGIDREVRVISNGHDAPSTIPAASSSEFQHYFRKADVIISKGQGNLEGLIPLNDKRIFYLLMVKCDVMAEFINVEKGSFVVFNNLITKNLKH